MSMAWKSRFLFGGLVLLLASVPASAAEFVVDDDLVECPGAAHTTIAAAVALAATGDLITLCPGVYSEPTIVVTQALIFAGSGTDNTFIESPGATAFLIAESMAGLVFRDLTIRNSDSAIRIEVAGGVVDSTLVRNVHTVNNTSRGIELHNDTTINGLVVMDSRFETSGRAIRAASSAVLHDLTVTNTAFLDNERGIHLEQTSGRTTSAFVSGCAFLDNTSGIWVQESDNVLVEDNVFQGNGLGFVLFKVNPDNAPVGPITLRHNEFTNHTSSPIYLQHHESGLAGEILVEENQILQDVSLLTAPRGMIRVLLHAAFTHAPVTITANQITFSGSLETEAVYGIHLQAGELTDVTITGNTVDGGGVGSNRGMPATAGVYLQTDDAVVKTMTATSHVDILCNSFLNLENGIAVYDPLGGAPGGIPEGAEVNVHGNNIVGNALFGLDNRGVSATINAVGNWWGDASGPSGVGPGTGDAVSENVDFDPFLTGPAETAACAGVADLVLTKTSIIADPPLMPGEPFIYLLTLVNEGPQDATNVVVTDPLPEGLVFLGSSCGATVAEDNTVTWLVGDLAVGESVECELEVQAVMEGEIANTAVADADQSDPVLSNNVDAVTVTVVGGTDPPEPPVLEIPTLSPAGAGVLALMLAALAGRRLRRRA